MRVLGRVLALSAAIWLWLGAAAEEQQRHIDMHGILDPTGVVSHIGETLGQAGRVLGLRIADSVANLVSSAFGHAPNRKTSRPSWTRGDPGTLPASMQPALPAYYQQPHRHQQPLQPLQPLQPSLQQLSVLGGILRLLGLDSSKLGAIALNGVIFLAQLISSTVMGRPGAQLHARGSGNSNGAAGGVQDENTASERDEDDDEEPAGSPLSWILDNPALKDSATLREAQDPDLSERLIAEIQRRFPRPGSRRARSAGGMAGGQGHGQGASPGSDPGSAYSSGASGGADTSCIQLLVCKAGPFLRGMQRSLRPVLKSGAGAPDHAEGPKGPKGDAGNPRDGGQRGAGQQTAEEVDEAEQWRRLTPVQRMFVHMPTTEEVLDQADTCAQRFPNCKVSY